MNSYLPLCWMLWLAWHFGSGLVGYLCYTSSELFIKNGMQCVLAVLGHAMTAAEEERWEYEVVVNHDLYRVEM